MKWKINYSEKSLADLDQIYEYICNELLMPETAVKQAEKIMEKIDSLETMPERYKIYEEEPWKLKKLRYFSVGNYLIFYLVNERENIINIVRIIYGKRDIEKQLNDISEL